MLAALVRTVPGVARSSRDRFAPLSALRLCLEHNVYSSLARAQPAAVAWLTLTLTLDLTVSAWLAHSLHLCLSCRVFGPKMCRKGACLRTCVRSVVVTMRSGCCVP